MQGEVTAYVAAHPAVDPNALYVVFGGANDYLNGGQTNPAIPVANITNEITTLAGHGARYFLVPNLPDLTYPRKTRPADMLASSTKTQGLDEAATVFAGADRRHPATG